MNIKYEKLGNRIRLYRNEKGLTQEQLSEMVFLNVVHISNIENGKKHPSLEALVNIAAALDVTADQLLADSLPKTANNKKDLNALLLDCSPEKVSILVDNFTRLMEILSRYQIKK